MGILQPNSPRLDSWAGTRWSVVSNLEKRQTSEWQASWTYLVETYRAPMERYVRRIIARRTPRPASADLAAEIVQEFLATCAEKGWLSRAEPNAGRFRAYLQVLLRRYTYRILKRDAAQRRRPGAGRKLVSLDESEVGNEPSPEEQAELDEFSRGWVQAAVDRALERLRTVKERYHMVITDLIATGGTGSEDLAERVGLRQPQLAVLKNRARKRFCGLFAEELAQTVGDQEAFDEEWRAIRPLLPPGV